MIKYECGPMWIYLRRDPGGDPDAGIDPEPAFEDIPDDLITSNLWISVEKDGSRSCRRLQQKMAPMKPLDT